MASSSSSSSIIPKDKYDVFLSFRGEDTRENFTSHLHAALCRKQIVTFIDDGLKRGDEISAALLKAIEESKISVIIFSKDYASSKWCLDELVKILDCKKIYGQMVIPVFYHVNPSDVRKQTGSFGDAFVKHERYFKKSEKIQKWRVALTEATNLSGWDSTVIRLESKLIDNIVMDILGKLNDISTSSDCKGLVGLNKRIKKIKSLLCIGSPDFRVVGIWGMGGIGKTTLAGAVFDEISYQFDGHCFSINVREESERYGLVHLRERILSEILGENLKVSTPNIPQFIQRRLRRKKVFIVLDDINDLDQLEFLAGRLDRFGPESRIIITSRDKQVLYNYGVHNIYEIERFNEVEALQLFCNYAFKQNCPYEDFLDVSYKVIDYARGNPLALKVLGSSLYHKTKREWESALHKLKRISNRKIHNVLKISYDVLDTEEQDIFLDIACFFKGEDSNYATEILNGCYLSVHIGLSTLIDKSLISVSDNNKLELHDLLQEMGWEIVRQESLREPGKRSRLWNHEDIFNVLKNNTGTDAIQGLLLDMSKITYLHLSSGAFENMRNLKFLKFYVPMHVRDFVNISKVCTPQGLNYLSDELRYLHWHGYPLKRLPSNFCPKNLIELDLPHSSVEQLQVETKHGSYSKLIDLNHSNTRHFEHCKSLLHLPSPTQYLNNLCVLNLSGCKSLRSFPSNIHFRSLVTLRLSNCVNLAEFPQISGNVKEIYLCGTAIEEVPSSIACLSGLVYLNMMNCERLKNLPTGICKLKSLQSLILAACVKLESFPEILENMDGLEVLHLDNTAIKELPSSIEHLKELRDLRLSFCKNLENIPSSIYNLTSLTRVALDDCSKLGNLLYAILRPSSIGCWKRVRTLRLASCNIGEISNELCCLSSLEILDLKGNNFETLPPSFKHLSQLKELHLRECNMLQSIPELPLRLEYLDARYCKRLQSLPELPSNPDQLDGSELELISESCDEYSLDRIQFLFINCLKMNQKAYNIILEDLQQRIQRMATGALRLCYEKVFNGIPDINICFPGSGIPEWFRHQSSGSSITLELPQHCSTKRLIGFAMCVVIGLVKKYFEYRITIDCNYHFETNYVYFFWEFPLEIIESDHIVLAYRPCMDVRLLNGDYTTVTFEFSPTGYSIDFEGPAEGCKVKCCGVCPLYAQLNVTEPSTFVQRSVVSNEILEEISLADCIGRTFHEANTSESGIGRSNEEEVEPDSNRNFCTTRTFPEADSTARTFPEANTSESGIGRSNEEEVEPNSNRNFCCWSFLCFLSPLNGLFTSS